MTIHQRITSLARKRPPIDLDMHEGFPDVIDQIADDASTPMRFLRAAWFRAAASDGMTLVARRLDGTPFAAIPTTPVGPAMIGIRGVAGGYWPFRSAVATEDATRAELAAMLAHFGARQTLAPAWRVGPAYADDPQTQKLIEAARRAGWTVLERPLGRSWTLDLAAAVAAGPWPRKSTARRLRTSTRQLESHGPVTIVGIHGSAWSPSVLDELAEIERRSWVGTDTDGSDAKFLTEAQRQRWRAVLQDPVIAASLHATILRVGARPVAFTFDMLIDDYQYGMASSYDTEFAAFSPGKLVTYAQFQDSIARGVRTVDLGAGDSGYKRDIGAEPGSHIVDYLIVRNRSAAALLRLKWEGRVGAPASADQWDDSLLAAASGERTKDPVGNLEQILLAGMVAATSLALIE